MSGVENPQAFPLNAGEFGYEPAFGMTLRDYFAGQALIGLMLKDPWGEPLLHGILAYSVADGMLRSRTEGDAA